MAELPPEVRWSQLRAVSCLGGIGFTMSLFISALAFPGGPLEDVAKVGIFAGSLLSVAVGWLLISRASRTPARIAAPTAVAARNRHRAALRATLRLLPSTFLS